MSQPVSEGKRLGRYKLTRRLATGGMAEVWLARATGIQGFAKDIVIKTILPHHAEDPEFVRMFVNEALLASGLNHPNIVQIFDLGRLGRAYFIAMEYIAGRSLRQLKRAHQEAKTRVPQWLVLRVALSACDALDYAHNQCDDAGAPLGIVHRDVTPENIMISFAGVTKVLDFGIAKAAAAGTDSTQAGRIKGKFAYLAPEQILGAGKPGGVDGRCDVYAIGVVLYELLTGRRPLRGANEIEMLRLILHEDPLSPAEVTQGIPDELNDIVMMALAKDPAKRYASALDLRTDLEAHMRTTGAFRSERDVAAHMAQLFPSAKRHDPKRPKPDSGAHRKRDSTERDEESRERLAKVKSKRGGPAGAAKGTERLPDVDVTIDVSEVEFLSEGAAELIEELDAAATDGAKAKPAKPTKAAPAKGKAKAAPAKGKAKAAPAKGKAKAVPARAKPAKAAPAKAKPTKAKPAAQGAKPAKKTAKKAALPPPVKKAPLPRPVPPSERETVKPVARRSKGKKALPTPPKSGTTPEPSSASVDDLGTGVPLSTDAKGRGETKPSAGVPAYGDSEDPAVEVGVEEALTWTGAAAVAAADLEPPASEGPSLTPSPAGEIKLGLPSPATTGDLPSPSTDGLAKPSTDGLPKPSTGASLPGPSTDGLPKPSTGGGLPGPSTDGLPKPSTSAEQSPASTSAPKPDLPVEPAAEPPSAPPSGDQITGDQRTPWDVLISRSRTPSSKPGLEGEEAAPDSRAADLAEAEPIEPPVSSHAWDMLMTRTRASAPPGLLPPFEDLKIAEEEPPDPDPEPQEPSPSEDEPAGSHHMWDAVLSRGARTTDSDEPSARKARTPVAGLGRAESSADAFSGKRRLSVSAEAQASAAFDEGLALMREGDREGACRAWERAVEFNPDERRYRSNLKMLKKKIEGEPR